MSIRTPILAAAAVAAMTVNAAAVAPAFSQPLGGIAVQHEDLNLAYATGRQILDRRIANAAEQVCGEYMIVELRWRALSESCQQDLIASVRPQRDALVGGELHASLRVSRAAN